MSVEGSLADKVLIFTVGSGRYGVPLEWICGVRSRESGDGAGGRDGRHNEELPLIDIAVWLGGTGRSGSGGSLLVVGRERPQAAALVDGTGSVVTGGAVMEMPALCRPLTESHFSGVLMLRERLILMVDPERLCRAASRDNDGDSQGGNR